MEIKLPPQVQAQARKQTYTYPELHTAKFWKANGDYVFLPHDKTEVVVEVEGTVEFIGDTIIDYHEGELTVTGPNSSTSLSLTSLVKALAGVGTVTKRRGLVRIYLPADNNLYLVCSGSGDWYLDAPFDHLNVQISGSGDVRAKRVSQVLASVSGSGDIDIEELTKSGELLVNGSGDITIRRGELEFLRADVSGSGDIVAKVEAKKVDLKVQGSGDIFVQQVLSEITEETHGSGDIRVAKRPAMSDDN